MMTPIQGQPSACQYLFGKEASEVFDTSKFTEEFINQSLETMMRVNVAFLSRKENDGFSLLDPAAFNNQCHLYALFSAKIRNQYKRKTIEEKLAKTQENRYLHLSFLLSFAFLNERRLICDAIKLAAKQDNIELPANQKRFNAFVTDPGGDLVRTARQSLNEAFERCIKETFGEAKEKSLLHKELHQLSLEDLRIPASRGKIDLYTFPKLAGVAHLINEKIPFIIKSKVMTREVTAGTLVYQSAPVKEDESVLVFEAITSEQISIDQFEKTAKRCPNYFFRNVSSKDRHSDTNESCFFCNSDLSKIFKKIAKTERHLEKLKRQKDSAGRGKAGRSKKRSLTSQIEIHEKRLVELRKIDFDPYRKNFEKATGSIEHALHALGADFVKELQLPFIKFFKDEAKYPKLTELFQKAVPNIEELGLSMKKPVAFTVDHVYVDDARHALQPKLRMNSSPETYLKERGFL